MDDVRHGAMPGIYLLIYFALMMHTSARNKELMDTIVGLGDDHLLGRNFENLHIIEQWIL